MSTRHLDTTLQEQDDALFEELSSALHHAPEVPGQALHTLRIPDRRCGDQFPNVLDLEWGRFGSEAAESSTSSPPVPSAPSVWGCSSCPARTLAKGRA